MSEDKKYSKRLIIGTSVGIIATVIGSVITLVISNRINDRHEARKQKTEEPQEANATYLFKAVINDPDGFTNVREYPSKQSDIVDQIQEGIQFNVLNIQGDWYKVESPSGVVGFVYFNRIQKLE
ncbi:MAG: SH3 domain-containing protein [Bacteroidetes bacterium]|nr:SH3 domain-containing protein [Bacteroidota bacterium]